MRLTTLFDPTDRIAAVPRKKGLDLVTAWPSPSSWWPIIRESFAGAWQRGITVNRQEVLTYSTVWACITLIAADIAKLWVTLVQEDANGICTPTENPAYSPVLRKPNHYSTWVKFIEYWMICKFSAGNTYVLKERDKRGVVSALYVLDPMRVQVMVAPDGQVYYSLHADQLAGLTETSVMVPASEIIHDICVPLFHPLVGVSPIYACGLAAQQGLKILHNTTQLFANGSNPGGVLTAPASISNETAARIKAHWEANYSGEANIGRVAVLGDGLTYTPMAMTAVDAEVVAQLKLTDERICATFHVPGYMVGIGPAPPYTDIQSINLQYYAQALQNPIENLERLLSDGLELASPYSIELDLSALLRMDSKTQMEVAKTGVAGGILSPDEARADLNREPTPGGKSVYLQQQMYSLESLARRDAAPPPTPAPALPAATMPETPKALDGDALLASVLKGLGIAA